MNVPVAAKSIGDLRAKVAAWHVLFESAPVIYCHGTFEDERGELVFCDMEYPVVLAMRRARVVIRDGSGVLKIKPRQNNRLPFTLTKP